MKIKFKDGTIKTCSTLTEQKLFKNGESAGWIANVILSGSITSDDADSLITVDNVSELTFISETEEGVETSFSLSGYTKVSATVIRHADGPEKTKLEFHLMKEA